MSCLILITRYSCRQSMTCRLYSSAVFNDTFPQHGPQEIANTALEGVVLAMKALAIDRVANFPFPSPPPAEALQVKSEAPESAMPMCCMLAASEMHSNKGVGMRLDHVCTSRGKYTSMQIHTQTCSMQTAGSGSMFGGTRHPA